MLKTLRDITQAVARASDLDSALSILVSQTKSAMLTQCCSIYLLEQQELILSATDGLSTDAVGCVKMPIDEGLVGLVAQREKPINLANAHLHPRFKPFPQAKESDLKAFLAVPIIYQKRTLGVLVVQQANPRQFDEAEEAFLMTLAAQLALAIRNLKKREEIQVDPEVLRFEGTPAAGGIAIAQALVFGGEIELVQKPQRAADITLEYQLLTNAVHRCKNRLTTLLQRFEQQGESEIVSIFEALLLLLGDDNLGGEYFKEIEAGWSAISAVSRVSIRYIEQFSNMEDNYLKERAADVRDIGLRVLRLLIEPQRVPVNTDRPVILITKEADATLLAEFPREKLAGIVTELGGVNSHGSIMARALGVPTLIGVEGILSAKIDNQLLIVNANRGQLLVSPNERVVVEFEQQLSAQKELQAQYAKELNLPTKTLDGRRIRLCINAGLLSSLEAEIAEKSDGVGLYRTEIPFMLRQRFPSEVEQLKIYKEVLAVTKDRPVVMRTLDVGGDKPLSYLPIKEENPFLGWRGIRLSLDQPALFLIQLRAMIQADSNGSQLHILLPMVSCMAEIEQAISYVDKAYLELSTELANPPQRPKIGIMIEVPALLYQLKEIAKRVDFVSVGSNDLTQYLLAVDRNNPRVNSLYDSYHPGVLRALKQVCEDCGKYRLPASVCGELAGEPIGVLLLIAMGYEQLSMNQGGLAKINYLVRRVTLSELSGLLDRALSLSSGQEVRELVTAYCDAHNFGIMLN